MEIDFAQYDVFISYSRKDSAMADRICQVLDQHQISYFIDRERIGGGLRYAKVI